MNILTGTEGLITSLLQTETLKPREVKSLAHNSTVESQGQGFDRTPGFMTAPSVPATSCCQHLAKGAMW